MEEKKELNEMTVAEMDTVIDNLINDIDKFQKVDIKFINNEVMIKQE